MSSVINTNIAATRTHNVYNRNNDYMNAAMTRVATGMKINSAKDGASTWAISEKMRERIRANDQANQNIQNDTALIKTAQGGVGNTIDILETLKERAINASNDSNMSIDRTAIATEVQQLIKQIDDNAAKVKFNGRTLLMGNAAEDTAAASASDSTGKTVVETTNAAEMEKYKTAVEEATAAWETEHATADDDASSQRAITRFGISAGTYTIASTTASPVNGNAAHKLADLTNEEDAATNTRSTGYQIATTDKIVLSWTDSDGKTQTSEQVAVGTNTLKTLATLDSSGNAQTNWGDGVFVAYMEYNSSDATKNYILDENGNRVTDANGNDVKLSAISDNGLYVIGSDGVAKDVKFTVYKADGTTVNTTGTSFITGTKVQEVASSSGGTDTADMKGDHTIYGFKNLKGASGVALTTTTALQDLTIDGNKIFNTSTALVAGDKITVDYGAGTIELAGTATVQDLMDQLAGNASASPAIAGVGINVQILTAAGENQYKDVDGNQVHDINHKLLEERAADDGLYFVSGAENGTKGIDPTTFTGITFSAKTAAGDEIEINNGEASYVMEFDNSTEADLSGITKPGANNSTLMFYIGGEANFGMTAELGKMTADNLFQDTKYTDASGASKTFTFTQYSDFSDLFLTKEGAQAALSVIDTALTTALNEQTKLGAIENRLGYASDNIVTMNENLEAADSAMRDSDIAKEMTTYMKYAVLSQASQYMLAQAGQNAFQVLNLLQQ